MICLRCGYCCHNYSVVIVDNPALGINESNIIFHEGNGTPCKHLGGSKPGEYYCKIHNEPWYEDTPCFSHGQIESNENCNCRIGEYILKKENIK